MIPVKLLLLFTNRKSQTGFSLVAKLVHLNDFDGIMAVILFHFNEKRIGLGHLRAIMALHNG